MNLWMSNSISAAALYHRPFLAQGALAQSIRTFFERRNLGALDDSKEGLENGKAAGMARGIVYSVVSLSENRIKALEKRTGEMLEKEVRLENRIDKNLIGGVIIYVEGKLIDASVKTRLETLKQKVTS